MNKNAVNLVKLTAFPTFKLIFIFWNITLYKMNVWNIFIMDLACCYCRVRQCLCSMEWTPINNHNIWKLHGIIIRWNFLITIRQILNLPVFMFLHVLGKCQTWAEQYHVVLKTGKNSLVIMNSNISNENQNSFELAFRNSDTYLTDLAF